MYKKLAVSFFLFLLLVSYEKDLFAQNFPERYWWTPGSIASLPVLDSAQHNPISLLDLDFQHALSLYSWSSSLRLSSNTFLNYDPLKPQFSISAEGRSRLREDTRVRTSEANAFINADIPFDIKRNGLTLSFFGSTYSLSANAASSLSQIGTLTNVTDGYGVLGGKYYPTSTIIVTAGGGIARKSFEIGTSSGTIIRAGIISSATALSDENTFDAGAALDERHFSLSDEVFRNDSVHAHLISILGDNGSNDVLAGVSLQRRDFFFPKDTSGTLAKQERSDLTFEFHDALQYPFITKHLIGNFRVDLLPHQITRRTPSVDISSFPTTTLTTSTFLVPSTTNSLDANLDGRLDLYLGEQDSARTTIISAAMKYDERSEISDVLQGETGSLSALTVQKLSQALGQASFDGKLTSLEFTGYFPLAAQDALRGSFSSRLYRYDTPSADNHDDRDELNLGSSLQYIHFFSSSLVMTNEIRLAKSHLVYLESDRSLQNYVGKTIAFSTQVEYRTPGFLQHFKGEVFANYAVYDFAAPVTSPDGARDYLIRGVNGSDSLLISLGKFPIIWDALSSIEGLFDLRLYERGAYNATAFTERPLLSTAEFSGDLTLDLTDRTSQSPALIKLGARAFIMRRFAPNTTSSQSGLNIQERLDRIGPLFIITLDQITTKGPRLYGSIWYSFVHDQTFDTNLSSSTKQVEARLAAQWRF